ncbi:MAG TPA: TonB-dependent receptor [Candidatus Saccharimonadales bacterium]|nr:TonB-dependent receptor [Candidatus Saccharimonadales bacterium]
MISQRWRTATLTVLAILFTIGIAGAAQAQSNKAAISGRVLDSSGSVLQGAEVVLEPGDAHAVSNTQGQFFINNIEPGSYTLTVTYVGFSAFTQEMELSAGKTSAINAKMSLSDVNTQVLVTADRAAGEAEAVNRERSADNIVQILPADVIRSLPNANMADAIGRLPSVTLERDEGEGKYVQIRGTEPRLTNATLDGVNVPSPESGVRQVKFDTIPADLVESVELNKTLQANMDGDGIGGTVNLVTKTAGERPTVALYGLGGYSPILGGRPNYESTATVGQRFGKEKRLGVLIGGSYDWNGRGIDDVEPVPDIASSLPGSPRYFDSQDLREYRYNRSRWGLAGSADYKIGDSSSIYIRGLYSDFKNYGDRWVYSLNDNTEGAGLLNGNGGPPSFNTSIRRPDYAIGSVVIGGRVDRTTTWYTWDVSVSRSRMSNNGYGTADFSVPRPFTFTSACQYDPGATTAIYRPQWNAACFSEAYNPDNLAISDLSTDYGKTAQLNLQFAGAAAKRYHLGSRLATIEIGGKFRNAHKFDSTFNLTYDAKTTTDPADSSGDSSFITNPTLLSAFPNSFTNGNYYGGSYKLGPNADFFQVRNFVLANTGNFDLTDTSGGNSGNFNFVEKVSAGYVMNTIDLSSRFRLIAGVRIEGTDLRTLSWDEGSSDTTPPIPPGLTFKAGGSYIKVLPSASLRYAVTDDSNFRLVYSRGFSRPDPQDIAQSLSVSLNGANTSTVSLGNPNLKAETADNFDLLFEHYLKPFGQIEAGVFYKNLYEPIVNKSFRETFTPGPGFPNQNYLVSQPVNAGGAHLYGFEISYIQHFSFLPGIWTGLGLSANYSYTDSGTTGLFDRIDHPHLLRQAPHTWNLSPTYDRGRISLRLGLTYNAASVFGYQYVAGLDPNGDHEPTPGGLKGPNSDTYLYAHFQVDAQGSLRLAKGFTAVVYGLNLNNEVFGFYNGSPQYLIQREYYTPTVGIGLRWSPVHEK